MVYMIRVYCVQTGLKMKAGDCPPLNMNAMQNISVKTALKTCISDCLNHFTVMLSDLLT